MKQVVQQCDACTRPVKAPADKVHLVASPALIDGLKKLWYEGLQGSVLTCSKTQPLRSDDACAQGQQAALRRFCHELRPQVLRPIVSVEQTDMRPASSMNTASSEQTLSCSIRQLLKPTCVCQAHSREEASTLARSASEQVLTCSKDIWVATEDLLNERAPRAGHTDHKNWCVIFEADGIVQELCNMVAWDVQLLVAQDIHDQLHQEDRTSPQQHSFATESNGRLADSRDG